MNKQGNKGQLKEELLIRFLNNECTPSEISTIESYITDKSYEDSLKTKLRNIWYKESFGDVPISTDLNGLLNEIHHEINKRAVTSRKKVVNRWNFIFKAAAAILLPILVFNSWYFIVKSDWKDDSQMTYAEYHAPYGSKISLDLPDGTKVWLNNGSSLKFPNKFNSRERVVELKGEGYFEVISSPKKPFVVKTSSVDIKAVGTKFNIISYEDDPFISTILVSGKVSLFKRGNRTTRKVMDMKEKQLVQYDKSNGRFGFAEVDTKKYTSWKDGKLIFIDDPLEEVVKRLSRWYNVEFELGDEVLTKYVYTATIENETLPQILELLTLVFPIEYEYTVRKPLDNNTFTKRKVILKIREGFKT